MGMRQNAKLTPLGRECLVGLIKAGFSFLRQHWPAVSAPRRRRSGTDAFRPKAWRACRTALRGLPSYAIRHLTRPVSVSSRCAAGARLISCSYRASDENSSAPLKQAESPSVEATARSPMPRYTGSHFQMSRRAPLRERASRLRPGSSRLTTAHCPSMTSLEQPIGMRSSRFRIVSFQGIMISVRFRKRTEA